jgi:membrane protein required for beta-lactamase induction
MLGWMFILAKPPRGDQGITPWLITIAYFVAAGLCFWAGRREREASLGRARQWNAPVFWFTLCGLLVALGFNKQLDLQSDLTEAGRSIARSGGWYENRRLVQAVFVMLFAAGAVAAVAGAIWFMRDLWKRYKLAFIGIIFLCAFVIIRAASFHHIDQILYHIPGLSYLVNTGLEMGGNVTVGYAAYRAATQRQESRYQIHEKKVSIR